MRSCIRLDSSVLLFQAFGSRSQVRHLIALLFLVPPAAKEGKGDCEFPLCPPWILLLPLCNAGHFVPRGGYGIGLLSIELSIIGGRFYDTWLIWEHYSLAQTMLLLYWGADAQLLLLNVGERSFLAAYFHDFVLSHGNWRWGLGDVVSARPFLDPLLAQSLCLTRN